MRKSRQLNFPAVMNFLLLDSILRPEGALSLVFLWPDGNHLKTALYSHCGFGELIYAAVAPQRPQTLFDGVKRLRPSAETLLCCGHRLQLSFSKRTVVKSAAQRENIVSAARPLHIGEKREGG